VGDNPMWIISRFLDASLTPISRMRKGRSMMTKLKSGEKQWMIKLTPLKEITLES